MTQPSKNAPGLEPSIGSPIISVIVCTYNRAGYLRKSIQSLLQQEFPLDQYEIIVVDNASTDETHQIVKEEFSSVSNLLYLYEPKPGLSNARNTGGIYARGRYLVYLDDDAVADTKWITNLQQVYYYHPEASAVGGKIELLWEAPRPIWLHDELLGYLGRLEYGNEVIPVHLPNRLGGGNFSIRKIVLNSVGNFSNKLGRKHSNFLSGEEIELMARVAQQGGMCYYTPFAIVQHCVPVSRTKKPFFLQRSYWQGYSDSVQWHLENRALLFGYVQAITRCGFWFVIRSLAWFVLYPFGNIAERFRRLCMVWAAWGGLRHEWVHLFHRCDCCLKE